MSDSTLIKSEGVYSLRVYSYQAINNVIRYGGDIGEWIESVRLHTTFRGSVWTLVGFAGSQLLRLAAMVILARYLLAPNEFGLLALITVFLSALNLLSDIGTSVAVIQHPRGEDQDFISTAFLIQVGRGIILWAFGSALAYPLALFYGQPELFVLALVGSISVLAMGFTSGYVWTLNRRLQFRELTLLRMGAEIAGLVAAILGAIISPTALALVVGRVVTEVLFAVGTHLLSEQPVLLRWDPAAARAIKDFGVGMLVSSATYFFVGEAERLVVGKFVTIEVLGCFSLALSIAAVATGGIQRLLSQVFFPMIASTIQVDRELAASRFRKTKIILLVVCACIAIAFIGGGNWIVAIVLGPKYLMASWMLQLIGFRAALELFISGTTYMLFALGISKYAAIGNIAKFIFLAIGLTAAFGAFGFREALWILAISPIVAHVPLVIGIKLHFRGALRMELWTVAAFLVTASLAAIVATIFN